MAYRCGEAGRVKREREEVRKGGKGRVGRIRKGKKRRMEEGKREMKGGK